MAESQLLLSPLAEADLVEIALFISDGNPTRARSFIAELEQFALTIAATPFLGRARNELRRGLRSIPFVGYSYTIYYRALPRREGIRVERVLHAARDVERVFGR